MKLGYRTLLSVEINKRPDTKFRQGFIGTSVAAGGSENKLNVPLLLPWGSKDGTWSLLGVGPQVRPGACWGGLLIALVAHCTGVTCSTLLLLLPPQKWQLGFSSFLYLLVHNFPHLWMHAVIFKALLVCLYFVAQRDTGPVAGLQQKVPGSSLSQNQLWFVCC